jgi:hypothetical protein
VNLETANLTTNRPSQVQQQKMEEDMTHIAKLLHAEQAEEDLQPTVDTLNKQIAALEKSLQEEESEEDLRPTVAKLEGERDEAQVLHETAAASLKDANAREEVLLEQKTARVAKIAGLNDKVSELELEKTNLLVELHAEQAEEDLQPTVDKLHAQIAKLEKALADEQAEEDLQPQVDKLNAQNGALEMELKAERGEEDLGPTVIKLEGELSESKERRATADKQVKELKELQPKVIKLEGDLDEAKGRQVHCVLLRQEADKRTHSEAEKAATEKEKLRKEIKGLEDHEQAQDTEIAVNHQTIADLKAKIADLERQLAAAQKAGLVETAAAQGAATIQVALSSNGPPGKGPPGKGPPGKGPPSKGPPGKGPPGKGPPGKGPPGKGPPGKGPPGKGPPGKGPPGKGPPGQ